MKTWFLLIKWWRWMGSLKNFPLSCARQSSQVTGITCVNCIHLNLQFSLRLYSCLRISKPLKVPLTLNSCFTKSIFFSEKHLKWEGLLSSCIWLLNESNCKSIAEDNFMVDKNLLLQEFIITSWYFGNRFTYFLSVFELNWNLNYFSRCLCINARDNVFQSCISLSKRSFTYVYWRLLIWCCLFFLFNHHFDNYYTQKIAFIFGFVLFHIKSFCIFLSWSIVPFQIVLTGARWIILNKAKVLKTVILPSNVKFLRFHNFSKFLEFLSYFLLESQISYCSVQP